MVRSAVQRRRGPTTHDGVARPIATVLLAAVLVASIGTDAAAQLVVHDAATTARNAVTATLKEYLYRTQLQQRLKINDMARRLSALTSLLKYSLEDVPRWRTHGGDFFYAHPYNDALIFGDPSGAAITALSEPLLLDPALLERLAPTARRLMEARLATVNLTDAAAIADEADGKGLQHDHPGENFVRGAHGFQRAEVAKVFQHERIKRLAADGESNDESEQDSRAERHGDAGVLDIPPDAAPEEFALGVGLETGRLADAAGDGGGILAGLGGGQDAGQHLALVRRVKHRLVVSGEEIRIS